MPNKTSQNRKATWRRFTDTFQAFLSSSKGWKGKLLFSALMVLLLGINGLNVVNSYVGRDFMSSIEHRDMAAFGRNTIRYILVFGASTVVAVLFRFCEERLGLLLREWLTERLARAYLTNRTYYRLDSSSGIANPDQRITDDAKAFTSTTLSFVLMFLNGTATVLSFSGVLWSIHWQLFVVAVAYASFGTLCTFLLGRPLMRLNYNQFDMEANFRADLIHVRENSESIALGHREGRLRVRFTRGIEALVKNYRRIIGVNRNLGFFTTGYNYLIQIIPALMVAPLFIEGSVEFGVITQSAMAFAALLGAFSLIVTQFQQISSFTAVAMRLADLGDAVTKTQEQAQTGLSWREEPDRIAFENVTLRTSDDTDLLVEDLNIGIGLGQRLLVNGTDEAAKVALFRAAASLWRNGTGTIVRPGLEEVLFLPERPYLPPGRMREVLLRTGRETNVPDEAILEVLDELGLAPIVQKLGGLDAEHDWDDVLSLSEQHMLSVARLFLGSPVFVLLDRPASALDGREVRRILELLDDRGIGCVHFARNAGADIRYDVAIQLLGGGRWQQLGNAPADAAGPPA